MSIHHITGVVGAPDCGAEITVARGENVTIEVTVTDSDGNPYSLSGATGWLTIKADAASAALIELDTSGAEGAITDAAGGVFEVYILPASLAALEGAYVYDAWVQTSGDDRHRVVKSTLITVVVPITSIP